MDQKLLNRFAHELINDAESVLNREITKYKLKDSDLYFTDEAVLEIVKQAYEKDPDINIYLKDIVKNVLKESDYILATRKIPIYATVTAESVINRWGPDIRPIYSKKDFFSKDDETF